ncbi:MAG: cob(I)yrinic acid a,c-diamide adenosyltransferase [Bacteroidales bacterium]|jgi:cob(I)alamin adenosyltransferase|nr:cob(I)yrinic acid a,c-diamide adenosyltransferase [Bacteroidales bacterium]
MKIYTKTGDKGETSIIGGRRLPKHHPRIEAYGTVDELIAWIGWLRGADQHCVTVGELVAIQASLMSCCSIIATDPAAKPPEGISVDDPSVLERSIDIMEARLPSLTSFILPGGHPNAANSNIARCVCRRAERALLRLDEKEKIDPAVIKYLNRLSDYLFVLSRCLSYEAGQEEVRWITRKK